MELAIKSVYLEKRMSKNNKEFYVLCIDFENGYHWENTALARSNGFMTEEMLFILKSCKA